MKITPRFRIQKGNARYHELNPFASEKEADIALGSGQKAQLEDVLYDRDKIQAPIHQMQDIRMKALAARTCRTAIRLLHDDFYAGADWR